MTILWYALLALAIVAVTRARARDERVHATRRVATLPVCCDCSRCGRQLQSTHGLCSRCGTDAIATVGNTYRAPEFDRARTARREERQQVARRAAERRVRARSYVQEIGGVQ